MPHSVRDFSDLPLLFVEEGEEVMGAPKKTRAELLDKMIQFIWDYQDRHDGETPALAVIGKNVGIENYGIGYYITILVDEGRVNKISSRPFRLHITDHKANQGAIARFKRLRERLERADEAERQRIREQQEVDRQNEQREQDRNAALSLVGTEHSTGTVVHHHPSERPALDWDEKVSVLETAPQDRLTKFTDAHTRVREINKEVKALMPKLLKVADERDLVFELVYRGYRVDKVR